MEHNHHIVKFEKRVTGHFGQKTFHASLLAQVLDRLHNSQWSFRTIIISEKHQYKRYTNKTFHLDKIQWPKLKGFFQRFFQRPKLKGFLFNKGKVIEVIIRIGSSHFHREKELFLSSSKNGDRVHRHFDLVEVINKCK